MEEIIGAALGERKCDVVLKRGNVVNVYTGEIYEADIGISSGKIVGVGRYDGRKEIDVSGKYISPGLIDAHTHVEMSMLSLSEFSKIAVQHGTTCLIEDPHEIANVLGIRGVKVLLREAKHIPLKVYVMAPSCVPSTDLETAGAKMGAREIGELLELDGVIGLAEMMNFLGVIRRDREVLEKIVISHPRPVDGHAPKLGGMELNAYVLAGMGSDHECTSADEALEKIRAGMWVMIREGSAARNLHALREIARRYPHRCMLVTDGDRTPHDLVRKGHLDHAIRRAVEEGIDVIDAIRMCTINPATWFKLDHLGAISPGKSADIVVLNDLDKFEIDRVFVDGKPPRVRRKFSHPEYATNTMRVKRLLTPDDFRIRGRGNARVIGVIEGEILTDEIIMRFDGIDVENDLLEIAVIERHGRRGNVALGLVHGFGIKRGAIASTVAHDSHNLIVVGADEISMCKIANGLIKCGGGIGVYDGKCLTLPLPIAGLMSRWPIHRVIKRMDEISSKLSSMGCTLEAPFLTLSFLSLPVIPKLRITDLGLVDASSGRFVDLFL